MQDVTERFAEVVAQPPDLLPLDEAVLLVAGHDHDLDITSELSRLDFFAAECADGDLDRIRTYLFDSLSFRGASGDYHHPDNSFLDRVIDRQEGLPILLCILTAEVAARVGVCLAPVGMPGHFLLRDCSDEDTFVDPFDRGALLDPAGCRRIYERLHPGEAFRDEFLDPIDNRAVLTRVVTNLVQTYHQRGPLTSLAWALHLRALLQGGDAWIHSALVQERTGNWARAAEAWDNTNEPTKAATARARHN